MQELGFGFSARLGLRAQWWAAGTMFDAAFSADRYMRLGVELPRSEALGFARPSGGYGLLSDGTYFWFAADVPRIMTGSGVLIEPAATNVLLAVHDLSAAAWSPSNSISVVSGAAAAPATGQSADRIVANTNSGPHILQQAQSFSSGTTYTLSAVLKADGYDFARVAFPSNAFPADGRAASFNLSAGTIGQVQAGVTARMQPLANGYHRCSVTVTATATATGNIAINIQPSDNAATVSFAGDGVSGLLVWCPQSELGPVATSPVVSQASAATRAADALTLNLPDGTFDLAFTFADDTEQAMTGIAGVYGVPTSLSRPVIASIQAMV